MTIQQFITNVNNAIINPLIILLFAVALIYFLYGVLVYIGNADNEEERRKGARHILWSIVGFFVMLGVYGIILLIINTFGLTSSRPLFP